jgi:hypothetical protein
MGARGLLGRGPMRPSNARALLVVALSVACLTVASSATALQSGTCNGCVPQLQPSQWNNAVIRPEIAIGFWGNNSSVWAAGGSASPSRTQIISGTMSLVNSPYFASLGQYGGSGLIDWPRLAPFASVYTGNAPDSFDTTSFFQKGDIINIINDRISVGAFPQPAGVNMIYVIFVPSGSAAADCPFNGCNGQGFYTDGSAYRYAVVGGNTFVTLTHELVEAISAYENVNVTGCGAGVGQIADVCNNTVSGVQCSQQGTQNLVGVQLYWSQSDGACVAPEFTGGAVVQDGYNWEWVGQLGVRQMYGGAGGIAYTNSGDDTAWFGYGGSVGWQIGGQNAILAPGGSVVASLGASTSSGCPNGGTCLDETAGIGNYNLAGRYWTGLGLPPPVWDSAAATGLLVTSGGMTIAPDEFGEPWCWTSRTGWVNFGGNIGQADQYAVYAGGVMALSLDHKRVYYYTGGCSPGATWAQASSPSMPQMNSIIANSDSWAWGVTVGEEFLPYAQPLQNEYQLFSGQQYAVTQGQGDPYGVSFMGMRLGKNDVYGETNTSTPWESLGYGPVPRMVSGREAYVAGCLGPAPACVSF